MNITINEKIDNFRNLLIEYYFKEGKEVFEIGSETLEACGFDSEKKQGEFWEMICPRLKREGVLRDYSPLISRQDPSFKSNSSNHFTVIGLGESANRLRVSLRVPESQEEAIKENPEQKNNFYLFEVNGKKLKAIKEAMEAKFKRINKEVVGQLRELTEKQEEKESWKKEVIEEIKKSEVKTSDKWLVFHTKDDVELKFNKENGDVKFGKAEGNLAPDTGEYKVFLHLLEASSHMAKYDDLMKLMAGKPLIKRLALDSTIRNIKKELKILPKEKSLNKDIFITRKSWKGYSLGLID